MWRSESCPTTKDRNNLNQRMNALHNKVAPLALPPEPRGSQCPLPSGNFLSQRHQTDRDPGRNEKIDEFVLKKWICEYSDNVPTGAQYTNSPSNLSRSTREGRQDPQEFSLQRRQRRAQKNKKQAPVARPVEACLPIVVFSQPTGREKQGPMDEPGASPISEPES